MSELLFPLWQIDAQEYQAVCAYLRLTPDARLYDHLSRYLAEAPFRFPHPVGFSRYLACALRSPRLGGHSVSSPTSPSACLGWPCNGWATLLARRFAPPTAWP